MNEANQVSFSELHQRGDRGLIATKIPGTGQSNSLRAQLRLPSGQYLPTYLLKIEMYALVLNNFSYSQLDHSVNSLYCRYDREIVQCIIPQMSWRYLNITYSYIPTKTGACLKRIVYRYLNKTTLPKCVTKNAQGVNALELCN